MKKEMLSGYQSREFATRATVTDTRELVGIGVPYESETELYPGVFEQFARGSVNAEGAKLFYGHEEPIGLVTATRETDKGLEIRAHISQTPRGDEVYTLLKDGVLNRLSIGFTPETTAEVREEDNSQHITWTNVRALEFSVVPFPAYEDAEITNVRQTQNQRKDIPMPNTLESLVRSDLEPINDALDRLEREIQSIPRSPETPCVQWRSMGEWLKAIATGDTEAAAYHERAFSGNTTTDTIMKDSFIGSFVKLAFDRRRVTNLFSTGVLPKDGLSVDYYQVGTQDFKAAKQASEGADLTGPSKLQLVKANTDVSTIGGWTEISQQAVERATVPVLDTLLQGMALKYAQVTDELVKTVLVDTISKASSKIALGADPATGNVKQWTDALIEAADIYGGSMFDLTGLGVSKDVFKALANLETTGNRLMDTGRGQNLTGAIDVPGLSGDLLRIPVYLIPGAEANTAFFFDREAIKTLESAGSPAMLQDSNIINLSKAYSIYGYHAVVVPYPAAIVPVVKSIGA